MKTIICVLAFLLSAALAYAGNGDLIVNGNLGVGTPSPRNKLEIYGLGADPSLSASSGLFYIGGSVTQGLEFGEYTLSPFAFWMQTKRTINDGTSWPLAINPKGGNVGIGTRAPLYKLHVDGTIYATGGAGALSDARDKDNIQDLAVSGLDAVSRLRPVTFTWKEPQDDGMKGEQIGFIAQEVEQVLPQAVLTAPDEDQTKGLKYNELIPILTKAIQEQQAQIQGQQARIEALEQQVAALQAGH